MAEIEALAAFRPGQPVLLRALDHLGRSLIGLSAIVVQDSPELVAINIRPGFPVQWYAGAKMGGPRGRGILAWDGAHVEAEWRDTEILVLKRPGEMHAVEIIWRASDHSFRGWYINLEEPSRRTERGFDIRDLELDIEIAPDPSWHRKDEDVFEWAIDEGRIPRGDRELLRAEGERALQRILRREFPFDREWETWRPDAAWPSPTLPPDRDR